MLAFVPSMSFTILHLSIFLVYCFSTHAEAGVPKTYQSLSVRQNNILNAIDWNPSQTPFPPAHRDDTTFTYLSASKGNVTIADPYHWFEEVDTQNDTIKEFQKAQVAFTKHYLSHANKTNDQIRASLAKAKNYTDIGLPQAFGPKDDLVYLYWVVEAGQENEVYYLAKQDELDQGFASNFNPFPGKKFFDTSLVGTNLSAYDLRISPDGKTLLYSVYETTKALQIWSYFRDVSNPLTNETVDKIEVGGVGHYADVIPQSVVPKWAPDSQSIFYIHDIRNESEWYSHVYSVRHHKLGTDVKDDVILLPADTSFFYDISVSHDFKYLVVYYGDKIIGFQKTNVYAAQLDRPITSAASLKWVPISVGLSSDYYYVTNFGTDFFFEEKTDETNRTFVHFNLDFSQGKEVKNLTDEFPENYFPAQITIPNRNDAMIASWNHAWTVFDTDKILIPYFYNGQSELLVYELKTGNLLQNVTLDKFFVVQETESHYSGNEIIIYGSSMNSPLQLFKFDWNSDKNELSGNQLFYEASTYYINPDYLGVQKWWITSTDGVQIPAFFLHNNDIQLDGSNPCVIEIYGGYGISEKPEFDPLQFALARDNKVVYILAGIRGGGEVDGEYWHEGGRLQNKHHSIEDTIAVANFVVEKNFSRPGKIVLYGDSAGALTAAAVQNEAPEGLFGGFIGYRGLFDLLRLDHSVRKDERVSEYGNPQDPEQFDWLYAYSPLQNIKKDKKYPIILLIPGIKSDFAEQWHPYKYLATLQYLLPSNPNPFLLTDSDDGKEEENIQSIVAVFHALGLTASD